MRTRTITLSSGSETSAVTGGIGLGTGRRLNLGTGRYHDVRRKYMDETAPDVDSWWLPYHRLAAAPSNSQNANKDEGPMRLWDGVWDVSTRWRSRAL
jgi:hypothetical protein